MKKLRKLYVETWWGENLPDYMGMQIEIREVQPVIWSKAITARSISWAEERYREGAKMLSFRFPVIKKEDLEMVATMLRKKLKDRRITVECRVMENGMIDAILTKKEKPKEETKPKDRWSVFLKR